MSATVRINPESHRKLKTLAEELGESMPTVLEQAIESLRRERFLEQASRAYGELRSDKKAWAAERRNDRSCNKGRGSESQSSPAFLGWDGFGSAVATLATATQPRFSSSVFRVPLPLPVRSGGNPVRLWALWGSVPSDRSAPSPDRREPARQLRWMPGTDAAPSAILGL